MSNAHPIERALEGYVWLTASQLGSGIGGYSRDDPEIIRRDADGAVVNVVRAREVLRTFHDWDLPSEDELLEAARAGVVR